MNEPIYNGLEGVDQWINAMSDDHIHLKIYNGKFTKRGDGKPFLRIQASDKRELIEHINRQLDGITKGMVTINVNTRNEGGSDGLTRYVKMGHNVNGIGGIQQQVHNQVGYIHPLEVQQIASDQASNMFDSWRQDFIEGHEKEQKLLNRIQKLEQKSKGESRGWVGDIIEVSKENPAAIQAIGSVISPIVGQIVTAFTAMSGNPVAATQVAKQVSGSPIVADDKPKEDVSESVQQLSDDEYNSALNKSMDKIEENGVRLDILLSSLANIVNANEENKVFFKNPDNIKKLESLFSDPVKMNALKAFM